MVGLGFWKIALVIGIILSLVAFVLGWIGFGVPDWQKLQRFNNSIIEYYGLWAYCQEQTSNFDTVCQRWPTAEDELFGGTRPSFIRTSEGLFTTGMILLSLGLVVAVAAAVLPLLSFFAALLAFLAFLFLVIGLPIFGRQSNNFSSQRGDYEYNKRYGFWLMVPTIVLEFLSIPFFVAAGVLYQLFGYGNIGTTSSSKPPIYGGGGAGFGSGRSLFGGGGGAPFGGQKVLGGPNTFTAPSPIPYAAPPPFYGAGRMASPQFYRNIETISLDSPPLVPSQMIPSLLSEYLAQRPSRFYGPTVVRSSGLSALPQPSIAGAIANEPLSNVTPAYLRIGEPVGPRFTPIINLTGETLVGPVQRTL